MVCEELHYSSLVLNANSKEKMNVSDSMRETFSLRGTKPRATEISQDKLVSILKRSRIFIALWSEINFSLISCPQELCFIGYKAGICRVKP
jgi:hypothetical protein